MSTKMRWVLISSFLFLAISFCTGEKGCPEEAAIAPCQCVGPENPLLVCGNIFDTDVLKKVFLNCARYEFGLVQIEDSVLPYIPHELFKDITISNLVIHNVTLTDIFDEPPQELKTLYSFKISECKVLRGVVWELLAPMTELDHLEVWNVSVKVLKTDFTQHATDKLKYIAFHGTETRSIKPGVFEKFVNLERLFIDYGDLTELRRDFFPTPFESILTLGFNGHPSLETLGEGLFTEMPNLEKVGLQTNNLTVIDSAAFGGEVYPIQTLSLFENPLACDCRLYWLLERPPYRLEGNCETPERLKGRKLRDLTDDDLNC